MSLMFANRANCPFCFTDKRRVTMEKRILPDFKSRAEEAK